MCIFFYSSIPASQPSEPLKKSMNKYSCQQDTIGNILNIYLFDFQNDLNRGPGVIRNFGWVLDENFPITKGKCNHFIASLLTNIRLRLINRLIKIAKQSLRYSIYIRTVPEGIYNPITAMGFSAMFTFQLDNTKR